jgi:hypothetical protein
MRKYPIYLRIAELLIELVTLASGHLVGALNLV